MTTRENERNAVRRGAFVNRAFELLPNLHAIVIAKAAELYGDVNGERYARLTQRLERRLKAWEALAQGRPFRLDVSGEMPADGHLDGRFAQCVRSLREAGRQRGNIFQLTGDGVIMEGAGFRYRFERSVFIPKHHEDGKIGALHIAESLLRLGGLYRLQRADTGFRLDGLNGAVRTWRLLLRVTRELGPRGRAEAIRRVRDGNAFSFQGSGPKDVTAVLNAGRMPREVREEYEQHCATYSQRLRRVTHRIDELEAEGRAAADAFAAQPDRQGAQLAAAKQELHDNFKAAQERLMRTMAEVCCKRDVPEIAPTSVASFWPRTRTGLSHRIHAKWDAAKAGFVAAAEALATAGEVPLEMKTDRTGQGVLLTLD